MRRGSRALFVGLTALALMAGAAPAAVEEPPAQDCDWLAAAPSDGFGRGVPFSELDGDRAVAACRTAVREHPDSLRLKAHLGRALIKVSEFDEARTVLTKAARDGQPGAQATLGAIYYFAIGVERDYGRALDWFEKAAKQGNAVAETNLGVMHTFGHGVRSNPDRAVRWFTSAAEKGHPDAQANLGNMYEKGEGLGRDYEEAAR